MKKSWLVIAAAIGLVLIASVAVLKTSGDDSRRQGALGSDEPVTLSWHGDWNGETQYAAGSVVTYEGASYVAEGEKLSTPKSDCLECGWTLLAMEDSSAAASEEETPAVPVVRGYERVSASPTVPAGATGGSWYVSCPKGKMPLNGGLATPTPPMKVVGGGLIRIDYDNGVRTGVWAVSIDNAGGPERQVQIYAACAFVD